MRIAISGSHSLGKSTFVNDFLEKNPDYIYEQEPYRALMHDHEILFGDDQTQYHIDLQLNYCIDAIKRYQPGSKVIFDRAPIDYIPYSLYTALHAHTNINQDYVMSLYDRIRPTLHHLDLIVFVPIREDYTIELENDGHRPIADFYRNEVDKNFKTLYRDALDTIMPKKNAPRVVEISGTREHRVNALQRIIEEHA